MADPQYAELASELRPALSFASGKLTKTHGERILMGVRLKVAIRAKHNTFLRLLQKPLYWNLNQNFAGKTEQFSGTLPMMKLKRSHAFVISTSRTLSAQCAKDSEFCLFVFKPLVSRSAPIPSAPLARLSIVSLHVFLRLFAVCRIVSLRIFLNVIRRLLCNPCGMLSALVLYLCSSHFGFRFSHERYSIISHGVMVW